jgi:hypothetical protein
MGMAMPAFINAKRVFVVNNDQKESNGKNIKFSPWSYSLVKDSLKQIREAASFTLTRSLFEEIKRRKEAASLSSQDSVKDGISHDFEEQKGREGVTEEEIKKSYFFMQITAYVLLFGLVYGLFGLTDKLLGFKDLTGILAYLSFILIVAMMYFNFAHKLWRIRKQRLEGVAYYLRDIRKNPFEFFPSQIR